MKAIQIREPGGPEVLVHVDLPRPVPQAGQILVRAEAIGVGKPDVLIRTGKYRWMPPLPAIPGNEMAGRIEALGPGVSDLRIGQPVLVTSRNLETRGGCYAEFIAVPAAAAIPLPEHVDLDAAVTIPNYQLALALLGDTIRGANANAKTVYIQGAAGGVASAVIDLCRLKGMTVIGSAGSEEKCAFAAGQGVAFTINYRHENVVDRVLELTDGRGANLILDHVAGKNFTDNLHMLAPMGIIISFNALEGFPEKDLFREMRAHLHKSPTVRCFSMHTYDDDPVARHQLITEAVDLFARNMARPTLFARLPLSEARRAHEMLDAGEVLGKLVLKP